jgi:hypothetical protein
MTLDVQVLVVAFLALSLLLVVEWTEREIVETDDQLHPENLGSREYGLSRVKARMRPSDSLGRISTASDSKANERHDRHV